MGSYSIQFAQALHANPPSSTESTMYICILINKGMGKRAPQTALWMRVKTFSSSHSFPEHPPFRTHPTKRDTRIGWQDSTTFRVFFSFSLHLVLYSKLSFAATLPSQTRMVKSLGGNFFEGGHGKRTCFCWVVPVEVLLIDLKRGCLFIWYQFFFYWIYINLICWRLSESLRGKSFGMGIGSPMQVCDRGYINSKNSFFYSKKYFNYTFYKRKSGKED